MGFEYKVSRNVYTPKSDAPFKISRSKIDLFMNCPRCFWLDRRKGIGRPPGFPFSLNSAVDALLKKEFDIHRAAGTRHPLVKEYGIYSVPLVDERMDEWRDALRRGITHNHEGTNLIISGGIDDVWQDPEGALNIVDYKATSKTSEVTLDADWQIGYKRQVEVYQWLFRQNGFKVSDTAYFVYCNGRTDKEAFDARLEFTVKIIPYVGNDKWVESTLVDIKKCLDSEMPEALKACEYCKYRELAGVAEASGD
ncbi:MAG: PD-(D/E)XK nuclease family protein [Patescibacteria group bacterium]